MLTDSRARFVAPVTPQDQEVVILENIGGRKSAQVGTSFGASRLVQQGLDTRLLQRRHITTLSRYLRAYLRATGFYLRAANVNYLT